MSANSERRCAWAIRPWVIVLSLAVIAATTFAADPSPSPSPAPEIQALAEKLASAADERAQNSILEKAKPELRKGTALRAALTTIGYATALRGSYAEAEKTDRLIIRFSRQNNDPEGVAVGQTLTGGVLRETGDSQEALSLLGEARVYFEKHPGATVQKASVYSHLGITHLNLGDFAHARAELGRALEIAEELKKSDLIIPALNSLGEVYRSQGQAERALEFYERARTVVGDDSAWNMAFLFNNMGMAYEAMGDNAKALDYLNRGRAVADKVKFKPRVATSLAEMGNVQLQTGDATAAARSYQQSLEISQAIGERGSEGRAHLGLARAAQARRDFDGALAEAQTAARLYEKIGQRDELAGAQTMVGRCFLSLGKKAEAQTAFAAAIATIEKVRAQLAGGAEEAETFFQTRRAPYQQMVALLLDEGKTEDALAMAERASARALLDILAKGKSAAASALTDDEKQRTAHLDEQVAEANRHLLAEKNGEHSSPEKVAALEAEVKKARHAREDFDVAIAAAHRENAPAETLQTASIAEMKQWTLRHHTALLRFVVTDEKSFLFVLHEKAGAIALDVFPIAQTRAELATHTRQMQQILAERGLGWMAPARAFYETLLQDSEATWKNAESLTIIPDGPLWELPFQTLRDEAQHPLLENHVISYAPSITFLARVGDRPEKKEDVHLLALANPALGDSQNVAAIQKVSNSAPLMGNLWEPLPSATRQVEELRDLYTPKDSLILTGEAAREDTFKKRAGDFDILHFATHGVINSRAPLYSYLLMSQEDLAPGQDGLLEAWELMQMKLRARLAVLSACETARGKISEGEGVIGLSWAFLAAGCPVEVVSQWKVDSASNADLMVDFHRRFRAGESAAKALREASLALRQKPEYRHPFYWAPFVVLGEN